MKYYVSRTDLKIVDGKLTGTETMREQNKRRKENPLTVADIAQMTEQAENELNTKPKGG